VCFSSRRAARFSREVQSLRFEVQSHGPGCDGSRHSHLRYALAAPMQFVQRFPPALSLRRGRGEGEQASNCIVTAYSSPYLKINQLRCPGLIQLHLQSLVHKLGPRCLVGRDCSILGPDLIRTRSLKPLQLKPVTRFGRSRPPKREHCSFPAFRLPVLHSIPARFVGPRRYVIEVALVDQRTNPLLVNLDLRPRPDRRARWARRKSTAAAGSASLPAAGK